MDFINLASIIITLTALFGYFNFRFLNLPTSSGMMLVALICSGCLLVLQYFGVMLLPSLKQVMGAVDFNVTLMQGMLSFLLFAGSLKVDLTKLLARKISVTLFTLLGVLISTLVVGVLLFELLQILGSPLDFLYCLLFGALISPTDPIAVLDLFKRFNLAPELETDVAGESLFNDGIGVVVFICILEAMRGGIPTIGHISYLFLTEAAGGIILGLLLGGIAFIMLRSIDCYQVELLITLALVMGGYTLVNSLHSSGPLAIVAAGILIGNQGRHLAMTPKTREHLDTFWELVDELLNSVLFMLLGLELLCVNLKPAYWQVSLLVIPIVLLARWISVLVPAGILRCFQPKIPGLISIMTWGGLRGGISVALVLSLPSNPARDLLLTFTYVVVVFSILVQGLTMPLLIKRLSQRTCRS